MTKLSLCYLAVILDFPYDRDTNDKLLSQVHLMYLNPKILRSLLKRTHEENCVLFGMMMSDHEVCKVIGTRDDDDEDPIQFNPCPSRMLVDLSQIKGTGKAESWEECDILDETTPNEETSLPCNDDSCYISVLTHDHHHYLKGTKDFHLRHNSVIGPFYDYQHKLLTSELQDLAKKSNIAKNQVSSIMVAISIHRLLMSFFYGKQRCPKEGCSSFLR